MEIPRGGVLFILYPLGYVIKGVSVYLYTIVIISTTSTHLDHSMDPIPPDDRINKVLKL